MVEVPFVAKVTRPRSMEMRPRPRLFRRLDELRRARPVPWVVAPAGSGKTVLVASYIDRLQLPAIWYRVDEADRDAEALFHYLRLAVDTFVGHRRASVSLPTFSRTADLSRFSIRFFEALFAQLPRGGMVVFDDHHLASPESPWQTAFEKGLGSIPPGKHVMVATRTQPASGLSRLRVHGDIGLLEAPELLFTEEETVAVAKQREPGRKALLSREHVVEIHAATGGWPAGVSLLLHGGKKEASLSFGSRSEMQPIFDYLDSAVFSCFSIEERSVLLPTACLPTFTVQDAETLSRSPCARTTLLALHAAGFFLERSDANIEVYRYHDLFRAFLRHEASRAFTECELRAILGEAAQLLREQGRGEEALDLFLQAEDFESLCELVLELAPSLFAGGRIGLLERWIEMLPARVTQGVTWLEYWRSMCLLTKAPSESRAGFERALEEFDARGDGTGVYLAWAGAVQALTCEGRGSCDVERWLKRFEAIEKRFPAFASADVGSQVAGALVMALTFRGSTTVDVTRWAERALALADRAGAPNVRIMTASMLLLNFALRGDSGQAELLLADLEPIGADGPAGVLASVAALAARTTLAWHRGDFEATVKLAEAGLASMAGSASMGDQRVSVWQLALLVFGGVATVALRDVERFEKFLDALADIAESGSPLDASVNPFKVLAT